MTALTTTMAKTAEAAAHSPRAAEMAAAASRMTTRSSVGGPRNRRQRGSGEGSASSFGPYRFRRRSASDYPRDPSESSATNTASGGMANGASGRARVGTGGVSEALIISRFSVSRR
jgi:hypothetical protein